MKISKLFSVPFLIITLSCNNDSSPIESSKLALQACDVDNPLQDLQWLKENIQAYEDNELAVFVYIVQGKYNGHDIFMVSNCCPYCGSKNIIFNCLGEEIELEAGSVIESQVVIWQHEDTQCLI